MESTDESDAREGVEPIAMWIKYTDSANHRELKHGMKYCVRDDEGLESYAKFHVYKGGEEVSFLCLRTNRSVSFVEFRELNKAIDLNT